MFVRFFNAFITKMCGRKMFCKLVVAINLIDFAAANEEICLLFSFLFFAIYIRISLFLIGIEETWKINIISKISPN